jgi:cytochrome c-type biogenesis protein CcmF
MSPSLVVPAEGEGLSPILQHPSMLIHPPIVFLGYAAWAIPFSLAAVALAAGQLTAGWVRDARPWALFAWTVLGGGILLGAKWAYEELGWGGYWSWDPVENGSLMPWLVGTAAIHTMMAWRHRGLLKKTALVLTMATFAMCNFATFLTRSGIFSSLHAFSRSAIGWLFLGLMVGIALYTACLMWIRREQLAAEKPVTTWWCRESMVMISTAAIVVLTMVLCVGTLSVAISDAIVGSKIVPGVEFYNGALVPIAFLVLSATAAAPLLKWGEPPTRPQRTMLAISAVAGVATVAGARLLGVVELVWQGVTGLFGAAIAAFACALWLDARGFRSGMATGVVRALQARRPQYAGFVIHLGLFFLAMGVAGSSLATQRHEAVLREGQTLTWQGYSVKLIRLIQNPLPEKLAVQAQLQFQRASHHAFTLSPAQHFHFRQNEWTTEISKHATWSGDFYTILHSGDGADGVRVTLIWNPLMRWIWMGGWIMGSGAVMALWPRTQWAAVPSALQWRPATGGQPRQLPRFRSAGPTVTARVQWPNS